LYAALSVQVPAQKEIARAKAVALLNRAEKLDPEAAPLRLQLAEGFNALGEYTKAARLYLDLLKKMPDVPLIRERVHARLTDIYLRGQDHRRAVEQLEAIIREDPTNPQAYYFLGSLAYESNKLSEAVDYFSKTILLNKEFEQAYYDLAVAQIGLNQSSQALATLEKARQQFPQNFVLEFWTGMAFSRQKDYTQAIQHYTAAEVIARATEPKRLNKEFYFQLGAACERKGDLEQAEKYFEKCLELAPNFAEALNYLGYMWAEHGTRLDKARDFIEKAVKLEPKNAAYLDSLGWVLYKLSKPTEALDYIVKAAQLSEQPDATVYDHLGDVYAALHQRAKALEAWQKSLSLEANDAVLKKVEGPPDK
jgi:tetratricopeptide (TPR) repeat protein